MCGRYYVDDDTAREIEKIIRIADEKVRKMQPGDIHPTETAPILIADGNSICCQSMKWGIPGFDKKQVIFNARKETACEKPTFREAMMKRRIVVPAAGFYEWNSRKEKSTFYRKESPILFMAGLYNPSEEEDRFVILTTAANASMAVVHDRMPLLLEEEDIFSWILDADSAKGLLQKEPYLLERKTDFEQLSLF